MPAPITHEDYREAARRRLPRLLFDYIDGGAGEEQAMAAAREALRGVPLRQRVLRDVSQLKLSTTLFGQALDMPVLLGPVGMAGMFARRGEVQAHRAALAAGLTSCLSTLSVCSVEEVARSAVQAPWFQLYMIKDRGYMRELLARARAAGCPVLVFTVDVSVPGIRYRDLRAGRADQPGLGAWLKRARDGLSHPAWLWDVMAAGRPHGFGNVAGALPEGKTADYYAWVRQSFDPGVSWDDLAWVREHWSGPIVLKGVLDPEDAREAVRLGVQGLVVSNHGGRQFDAAPAPARQLPRIADAVGHRCTVLMDGGVRTGQDVLRCLALGADGVMLGRAWAMALAARGEAGVAAMLQTMKRELSVSMALAGCTDVADAGAELLA